MKVVLKKPFWDDGISWFLYLRRRVTGDVYDGGSEEILQRDEEDGLKETTQGHSQTKGKSML